MSTTIKNSKDTLCRNCQHACMHEDKFCPACGQKRDKVRISMSVLLYDLFSGMFNIDNRILKTIRDIWIPAKLTRKFFEGKRISYTHPLKLYLFLSFILFGLIGYRLNNSINNSSIFDELDAKNRIKQAETLVILDSIANKIGIESSNTDYGHGAQGLLYLYANRHPLDTIQRDTLKTDIGYINVDNSANSIAWSRENDTVFLNYEQETEEFKQLGILANEIISIKMRPDSLSSSRFFMDKLINYDQKLALADLVELKPDELYQKYKARKFVDKLFVSQASKIVKNPANAVFYILSGFSWVALMFIPFMALFFKLLYIRRKYFYIEHFVFIVHATSLLFLIVILILFYQYFFPETNAGFLILLYPFFLLLAMKNFYSQNWLKSLIKWVIGQSFGLMVILILFMLSIVLRMILY